MARKTYIQIHKHTDRQTDRERDRHADIDRWNVIHRWTDEK